MDHATSPPDDALTGSDRILVLTLVSIIQVTGVLVNVLAIVTMLYSPKVRLNGQGFVLTLCFSDLLFIGIAFPFIIVVLSRGYWPFNEIVCKLQGFLVCWACATSMSNMAAIALVRFLSVAHTATYKRLTPHHLILMMLGAWFYSFMTILPSTTGWGTISFSPHIDSCLIEWTYRWSFTYFVISFVFLVPFIIISFCYFRIFSVFWASQSKLNQGGSSISRSSRKDKRLALQLLILLVTYMVCWGPYFILVVFIDTDRLVDRSVYDIIANLLVVSSIADPCIYFFSNPTMRKEAKKLLCPCWYRGSNAVQSIPEMVSTSSRTRSSTRNANREDQPRQF